MSNNNAVLIKVNRYVTKDTNNEAAITFFLVCYTYVPYKLQEYVESDGNLLASDDLVFNSIYISP